MSRTAQDHFVLGPNPANWDFLNRDLEIDPIDFEIIRHKLDAINQELGIAVRSVSISEIVTEANDFNVGLYTPEGEMVSMGPYIFHHAGSLPEVLRHTMEDCQDNPGIGEGDMFAVNDPFKGAVHHPDISVVSPIHYQGEQIGWSGATAHLVDVGGLTVGSISTRAVEKQQEGMMLPPIKLVEGGTLRQDVWRMILNMSRQPDMIALDIKGLMAANHVAQQRMESLCEDYGVDTVKTVMSEVVRYSERKFRQRLRQFPSGVYRARGYLDHDGHENRMYHIDLEMTKDEDVLRLDFSGSSEQAPGVINCVQSTLMGAAFGGVSTALSWGIPWNHGILNGMEIVCPSGKVCNAEPPAPTGSGTIGAAWIAGGTTVQAVSKMLALHPEYRDRSIAVTNGTFTALSMGGQNQYGDPWGTQLMDACLGGGGAWLNRDGLDQSGVPDSPRPKIPNVEGNENGAPILYLYRSFYPGSGGDGQRRGGRAAGLGFKLHDVERLRCSLTMQGVQAPVTPGIFGGLPGDCNRQAVTRSSDIDQLLENAVIEFDRTEQPFLVPPDSLGGETRKLQAKEDEFELRPGDVFQYRFQGGGGIGDPLRREPEAVLKDLQQQKITQQDAEKIYGVVLSDGTVEQGATEQKRTQLREQRLQRSQPPEKKSDRTSGKTMVRWGTAMRLAIGNDNAIQLECRCGNVLSTTSENWREYAAESPVDVSHEVNMERLHEEIVITRYVCPQCGEQLSVDIRKQNQPVLHDLELKPGSLRALPRENGI